MKVYGLVIFKPEQKQGDTMIKSVRVFAGQEERDEKAHDALMKGQNHEVFELEVEGEQSHQERHQELHGNLDELAADCMMDTGNLMSETSVMELMAWSHQQTEKTAEGGFHRVGAWPSHSIVNVTGGDVPKDGEESPRLRWPTKGREALHSVLVEISVLKKEVCVACIDKVADELEDRDGWDSGERSGDEVRWQRGEVLCPQFGWHADAHNRIITEEPPHWCPYKGEHDG